MLRDKRRDIFGHSSEDEESLDLQRAPPPQLPRTGSSGATPPPRAAAMPAAAAGQGGATVGTRNAPPPPNINGAAKAVPGMFSRTGPAFSAMTASGQPTRYAGPIDVDTQEKVYVIKKMVPVVPGSVANLGGTAPMRRPSVEEAESQLRAVQHQPQGIDSSRSVKSNGSRGSKANSVTFHNYTAVIPPGLRAGRGTSDNDLRGSILSQASSNDQHDKSKEPSSRLRNVLMKKRQNNPSTHNDETGTHVSQKTSSSSVLSRARSKLKGYLSTYKKQTSHEGTGDPSSTTISGTKDTKYRPSSKKKSSQDTTTTSNTSSHPPVLRKPAGPSADAARNFHNSPHQFSSAQSHASGIDSAHSIKTKYSIAASVPSKKSTKLMGLKKNAENKGFEVQVFDLPWRDNRPNSNLQGKYSGPVDESLLPHGKGSVVLDGNESLHFLGVFEHGTLASYLICDGADKAPSAIGPRVERDDSLSSMESMSKREPQEPSGVTIKDIPFGAHSAPRKQPTKKRKPKDSIERRTSTESNHPNMIPRSRRASTESNPPNVTPVSDGTQTAPSRQKYILGDIARTPRDMIIHKSNNEAIHSASLLKKYERAFIKRSNGLWTVAILADRSLQPTNQSGDRRDASHWYTEWEIDPTTMALEDSMLFVINGDGATKIVQRRHWGKFVRRMDNHDMEEAEEDADGKSSTAGTDEA